MIELKTIESISVIIASLSVLYGIGAWRREHRGRRQIELAEETLALFYEASDAIINIRCPMSSGNETADVEKSDHESEEQFAARKKAFVVYNRYDHHQELFSKIHAMRYRFMAQIGAKQAEPFDELRKLVNKILHSAHSLTRLWAQDYFISDEQKENHFDRIEEYEAIFWDSYGDGNDPINPKLEKVISEIEKICIPIISGKATTKKLLNIIDGKSFLANKTSTQ